MNTPDSNPLFERIAEAAYRSLSLPAEVGMKRDYETTWAWTERMGRAQADQIAAAVLPTVATEVRKAKAEALREAASAVDLDKVAEEWSQGPGNRNDMHWAAGNAASSVVATLHDLATEHETGDSEGHR